MELTTYKEKIVVYRRKICHILSISSRIPIIRPILRYSVFFSYCNLNWEGEALRLRYYLNNRLSHAPTSRGNLVVLHFICFALSTLFFQAAIEFKLPWIAEFYCMLTLDRSFVKQIFISIFEYTASRECINYLGRLFMYTVLFYLKANLHITHFMPFQQLLKYFVFNSFFLYK